VRFCRRRCNRLSTWLLITTVIAAGPTLAQTTEPASEQLQAITIIGKDQTQTGDVIDDEQSVSSSRISREELTRTPSALAEIISRETGVQYQQSGGFGSYARVSIRAASAAQTGVYLDGILLNSGGNPVVDLSTLEILNLGSVDIYRGSTPLQLGHAGIGGAVNLNTLEPGENPETRIRLGLGSYSERGIQASHQSAREALSFVTAVSYRESKNNFSIINNKRTPLNPDDDERQTRQNAQAQRSSMLLQGGYRHSKDSRTSLTLQAATKSMGVPQWRNSANNSASFDTLSTQLQLSHVQDNVKAWNTRHSLYWHVDDSHFKDVLAQIGLGADDRHYDTDTLGAKTYWEYPTSNGVAGLSMDFRSERLNSSDRLDRVADYTASQRQWLTALHYTWFDSSDKWTVTPALRWQHNTLSGNRLKNGDRVSERERASHAGAQFGISFRPVPHTHISMNVGTFYRTPSFGELYGSIGLIDGNDELNPEKGINADIGISWDNDSLSFGSSLFMSDREDLIVTAFDSRGVGRPVNSGKAHVSGIETSVKWTINPHWAISSNLTWQTPKSVDRLSGFYDKFLPGESQLAWFTRVQYSPSLWTFWYEADVQQKRFYDRANVLPAADYTQHSIGLGWLGSEWNTTMSVKNLSDTNVEDFNGFPKPGRHWSLTVTRIL